MPPIDRAELERRFKYHAPNDATRHIHEHLRAMNLEFVVNAIDLLPGESREKSLFLTAFEEASFWAHAHLARNVGLSDG